MRLAPNPTIGLLTRKREGTQKHTGESSCDYGTEIGGMQLKAHEHRQPPEASEWQEKNLPWRPQRERNCANTMVLDSWLPQR